MEMNSVRLQKFTKTMNIFHVYVLQIALLSFQGREILQSTVDLVQNNLNLEVGTGQTHADSENSPKTLIIFDGS